MKRFQKCAICSLVLSANGAYKINEKMQNHWEVYHLEELRKIRVHNSEVRGKINELKNTIKILHQI